MALPYRPHAGKGIEPACSLLQVGEGLELVERGDDAGVDRVGELLGEVEQARQPVCGRHPVAE